MERIGRDPAPMGADYAALVAEGQVWVAVDPDDAPIGVLAMRPEGGVLLLENVAVEPSNQRRGLGAELIAFAEDHARGLGLFAVTLYTNERMTENLAYYPARGYVETGRRHERGFDRVFFRKEI